MKKLKSFSVKSMASLSREEMAQINGGEFMANYCLVEGQKCAVVVTGGVNIGTCKWVYVSYNKKELTCDYI